MPDPLISFFEEDVSYTLKDVDGHTRLLIQCVDKEGVKCGFLNFVFCSDQYVLDLNKKYLDHDYFTDILTFDQGDAETIAGDIFISIDRAMENAVKFKVALEDEVRRLLIHGVLHLVGYKDATDEEKSQMRSKEDYYLSLWTI